MPSIDKPILDVLDERAQKRKAATQGEWTPVASDEDVGRAQIEANEPTDQIVAMFGVCYANIPDARHIVTEHNTGEQVDAACRMLIDSFKALRHMECNKNKPDGCMYGDLGCSEAADVLNKLGVKLED